MHKAIERGKGPWSLAAHFGIDGFGTEIVLS
jgi:hypothetical protein